MNYTEALNFIHSVSWRGSVPGLSRTRELLDRLGNPQDTLRFVHIAGTNGKGSTAAMLSSVLTAAGLQTGLYTSPFISRFNERMQIGGAPVPDATLAAVTEAVAPHARAMEDPPTEFELVTAIALKWFADSGCDIVVLEAGLGGRLDSTNVIGAPDCAVITNIGLDHTRELGDTVELIAAEKAGIIKPGSDVLLYECGDSVREVIAEACERAGARLHVSDFSSIKKLSGSLDGQTFIYKSPAAYFIPLLGEHQLKNAAVALETVEVLRQRGFDIPADAVRSGLAGAKWPARFELLSRAPLFVADGGHNPQCAQALARNLADYFPGMPRVLLIGMLRDKDVDSFLNTLDPLAGAYVATAPASPRALPAQELAEALRRYGKPVTVCESIPQAVETACEAAGQGGMACATGSLYLMGPVRVCFGLY